MSPILGILLVLVGFPLFLASPSWFKNIGIGVVFFCTILQVIAEWRRSEQISESKFVALLRLLVAGLTILTAATAAVAGIIAIGAALTYEANFSINNFRVLLIAVVAYFILADARRRLL